MKTIFLTIMIKLLILDSQTQETIPAAKVETNKNTYYSDFDGYVTIPKDESIIKISYISYKDIKNLTVKSDTTIVLESL